MVWREFKRMWDRDGGAGGALRQAMAIWPVQAAIGLGLAGLLVIVVEHLTGDASLSRPAPGAPPVLTDVVGFGLGVVAIVFAGFVFAISSDRPLRRALRAQAIIGTTCCAIACLEGLRLVYEFGMAGVARSDVADVAGFLGVWTLVMAAIGLAAIALGERDRALGRAERRRLGVVIGTATVVVMSAASMDGIVVASVVRPNGGATWFGLGLMALTSGLLLWSALRFVRSAASPNTFDLDGASYDPAALAGASILLALSALIPWVDAVTHVRRGAVTGLADHLLLLAAVYLIYRSVVRLQIEDVETRRALAVETARVGAWSLDVASGMLSTDAVLRSAMGGADPALELAAFRARLLADDRPMFDGALASAVADEGNGQLRVVCRIYVADHASGRAHGNGASGPPDGTMVPVQGDYVTGRPFRWLAISGQVSIAEGGVQRVVGVMQDITEHRLAEAALHESVARLHGIISIAADAIISIDETQHIIAFNHGAENIFGYSAEDAIDQPLSMLLPERHRASHAQHVSKFGNGPVQSRRMGERAEITALRKSGEVFFADASISKLDVDGRRIYTVVLRDVTERRDAEALLQRRIDERTQELRAEMKRREASRAQLVQTQKMEAFGQLTGGIAHDFNNLLTVITGNLELLEMRIEGEKERRLLGRAQEASEMGARLTSRLLLFARRRTLEPVPINLNELVMGLAELLERTLGELVHITTRLESDVGTVVADPSELENAILNLAINARDAMPDGGRLLIETANVEFAGDVQLGSELQLDESGHAAVPVLNGSFVRLSMTDSGTGMTDAVKARAFEPFFSTKEPGRGSGLGLSTIYGLTKGMGGAVTLDSAEGRGTTVNVFLPRTVSDVPVGLDTGDGAIEGARPGERVLLVEDSTEVRETSRAMLEALGYSVIAVPDGRAAVDTLTRDTDFAVVFSDVVMGGGLSGFDVARWVREHHPGVGLLLASGFPDATLAREAELTPAVQLLRKPYSRSELARGLRRSMADVERQRNAN